jgi:hypothetical protein
MDEAKRHSRDLYLRRTHNISLEEYEAILVHQGGHCAICPASGGTRSLHVDHDHKTGAVRGLLCFFHNALLMRRGVTSTLLRLAADYLDHPPATAVLGEDRLGKVGPIHPRKRRRRRRKRT